MAKERVLVMEDSLVYRQLIVDYVLKPSGYEPLVAVDGEEGLQIALREVPDLIITDLRMPGMDGIAVLQALQDAGHDIPVILMTLHGSEDLVVQAFRLGAKDYVIKPFDVEEMLAAIDRALTEVRLRRERDALTRDLLRVNQQLEAVLTHTEDAVLLVGDDAQKRIILVNHAARQAFGIDGEATGQPLAEVVCDGVLLDVFDRVEQRGESARAEIGLPDERTLNAHVTPIPGVGQAAVMQDITRLKELDRIKSELVSTVSHDLRSPLTSIKGFADLMPMVGELNEQQVYFLTKIQRGVENVTEMVSDLLDLGRIEAEAGMEMEACDIGGIVHKSTASLQSSAEYKHQVLKTEIEPRIPPVLGNPPRLVQAISNLVGNAIKYTPEYGHIVVAASAQGGQILVTVQDDGIGIPAADLPHIFDKFYRVKSAETDNIVGSGLGLSLVKSIVDKHEGRIWVDSQVGSGSTFAILLQAAQDTKQVPALLPCP